jgi:hypothetical protein
MASSKVVKSTTSVQATKQSLTVKAYRGDNKTLLAFNFTDSKSAANLAGFTIQCKPPDGPAYYLLNELQFENPAQHAQVASERANSTVNAPIQKFRWVHFPGSFHQGTKPATGAYTYTVTPRYFQKGSMQPMDPSLSAAVTIQVAPFLKAGLALGFTRGYMQSEAFTHHFGLNAKILPATKTLEFDTSQVAGTDAQGGKHTFEEIYEWMGATARQQVFALLNEVLADSTLQLDMFAYDLNEPDLIVILMKLAKQGRIRVILDNASLHTSKDGSTPEDQFTALFQKTAPKNGDPKNVGIVRGKFARFSHDKIFIISKMGKTKTPQKVLTGSTNFSVTGLYVNANHVLVYDDPTVAEKYEEVFELSWDTQTSAPKFSASPLSAATGFDFQSSQTPSTHVTFSPHTAADEAKVLGDLAARINAEAQKKAKGSVLFAVMQLTGSPSPVYDTLDKIHGQQSIFSYGISDSPSGVTLYSPGSAQGVLVTGKPGKATLPPPFDQVPSPPGHEIHDKFVVCGFNGDDPVVYCGSSNLATGGEQENGDNLLAVHDADVATAFAIEALLLVDHYNFLDRFAAPKSAKATKGTPSVAKQPASKQQAAVQAKMFLPTTDAWAKTYFDPRDLHSVERQVFAQ